jgi:putative membrane protein
MMGFGMGFGIFGALFMLFFWGGLILLAVWLVKALFQGSSRPTTRLTEEPQTPRDILDQRYARGEITRDQYEIMRQDIQ